MSNPNTGAVLTPTQAFYKAVFDELPQHDLHSADLPGLVEIIKTILYERSTKIVVMRFGLGCEPAAIAKIGTVLGLSKSRMGQLEKKLLQKLRNSSRVTRIRQLFGTKSELLRQIDETERNVELLEAELEKVRTENAFLRSNFESRTDKTSTPPDSIGIFGFSTRTNNCLRHAGIESVSQLIECYHAGLILQCRNLGKGSLAEIETALAPFGAAKTAQKPYSTARYFRWSADMAITNDEQ